MLCLHFQNDWKAATDVWYPVLQHMPVLWYDAILGQFPLPTNEVISCLPDITENFPQPQHRYGLAFLLQAASNSNWNDLFRKQNWTQWYLFIWLVNNQSGRCGQTDWCVRSAEIFCNPVYSQKPEEGTQSLQSGLIPYHFRWTLTAEQNGRYKQHFQIYCRAINNYILTNIPPFIP